MKKQIAVVATRAYTDRTGQTRVPGEVFLASPVDAVILLNRGQARFAPKGMRVSIETPFIVADQPGVYRVDWSDAAFADEVLETLTTYPETVELDPSSACKCPPVGPHGELGQDGIADVPSSKTRRRTYRRRDLTAEP